MATGFIFVELRLISHNADPASVIFKGGLNIISGPSNTGKTYIYQCLNYMLGGTTIPKKINEANDYSLCYFQIESRDAIMWTLKSDLVGGDFHLYEGTINNITTGSSYRPLSRTHDSSNFDNISQWLLGLCNLQNKAIKTNAQGKKRGLSYRDLSRFCFVDETKIITDKSPIISGQYILETAEKSTFKLILTGKDDSDVIEILSEKQITHRKGKIEMLTDLISETDTQINYLNLTDFEDDQLNKIDRSIASHNISLNNLNEISNGLAERKTVEHSNLLKETDTKNELVGVQKRSDILAKQYESDTDRLRSTIEACELLSQGGGFTSECPICHSITNIDSSESEISNILQSCMAELEKIANLRHELSSSQRLLVEEINSSEKGISDIQESIRIIDLEIEVQVQDKVKATLDLLTRLHATREILHKYILLSERRKSLIDSRDSIARSIPQGRRKGSGDSFSSLAFKLTEEIQSILLKCNYPGLMTVSFNEEKMDFLISGQDRELAGKGYRAITYSAFIIALQKILLATNYSIGIPVLDSPLVTYRKPEAGAEDIPIDVAMDFYRYLSSCGLEQIIVLENEEPPSDIEENINHIVFTQSTETGRYGFIPIS